ncbi:MAG: glycoside hydrolase family 3 C-terminal domain-containing protein, partial [Clostridia bacterium]|nr:glycoside hydrolase family 3 C-terminal domain-containing protein [Clostridia bacterium]
VNGKYANENQHLLVDILRKEWGFDGIVVTDWGASNDHTEGVKCQSNVEMPNPGLDSARELLASLKLGKITEEEIDRAIEPIIEAAVYFKENKKKDFNKEAHHRIARQAAVESAVLLKNEKNILPLKDGIKVALRGPFVNKPRYQGAGSSQVNATKVETIAEVIKNYDLEIVEDPKAADVVLFFFGLDEIAESEGADRTSMDIPEYQIRELEELAVLNSNIVGVMSAGSAVKMPWLNKLTALLHGYLTGQAGASALLDLITGKEIPTGKLAESYPFAYADCSMFNYADEKYRNLQYREGPFIGYRYYDTADIAVQFPFGYGLSYTTFAYDSLVLTKEGVRFTITNTGMRAGAEIAQLYVGKKESKLVRPKKELKGFTKVWLEAGESKEVEIRFDDKTFRYFNTKTNQWEIEGGVYTIMIGASSADIRLSGEMEKQGTTDVLPYDIEKLPSYKSGLVRNVHYEEFQLFYGDVLPEEKVGLLDINDALCQMKYAKSGICRLVYKILQGKLDKAVEKGVPDLNTLFIYNMPFRAICKMTGGMVSREMAESIVTIANGHFFRGVAGVIGGFFRNMRANKKYEALLKNGK